MGKVTYDQSGYCGSSMSERAACAYAGGEMPRSKWTKAAMMAAIEEFCEDSDVRLAEDVSKLRKAEIFERFFWNSSWHHTSKFANPTDFYAVDEDAVLAASVALPSEEIAAREAAREAARKAERERLEAARREREAAEIAYRAVHRGLSEREITDPRKLMDAYPELFGEPRKSKSGKSTVVPTAMEAGGEPVMVIHDGKVPRFSKWVYDSMVERAIEEIGEEER